MHDFLYQMQSIMRNKTDTANTQKIPSYREMDNFKYASKIANIHEKFT